MTDAKDSMGRVDDLEGWLCAATKGLGDAGRERVAGEIRAHYKDAVEAARREGKSLVEAKQVAIEGLGKPKKANRVFRRTYLMTWEEKELEHLEWSLSLSSPSPKHPKLVLVLVSMFIFGAFVILGEMPVLLEAIQNPGPTDYMMLVFSAGAVTVANLRSRLGLRLVRSGALDRLPLWVIGNYLGFFFLMTSMMASLGLIEGDLIGSLLPIPIVVIIVSLGVRKNWKLYRKMRVLGEDNSHGG